MEAVKLVDCSELQAEQDGSKIPDGRILPKGMGIDLTGGRVEEMKDGRELLKHASRTENGFYVVDADRRLPK